MVLQHGSNGLAIHIEYFCNAHRIILYPKSSKASIVLLHGDGRDLLTLSLIHKRFARRPEASSLVPRPRAPPGEKRSGERSQIPWAYYPKRVMTNEIARLVIIT